MTDTHYAVTWHARGSTQSHETPVMIVDGYSTVDDIPAIIAASRTGRPDDGELVIVESYRQVTA